MSERFTPGPWQRGKYGAVLAPSGERVAFRDVTIMCAGTSDLVAEAEANTNLATAGPELFAAAEAAIAYDAAIAQCGDDPNTMSSFCTVAGDNLDALYDDWISKSRAALAKARGE